MESLNPSRSLKLNPKTWRGSGRGTKREDRQVSGGQRGGQADGKTGRQEDWLCRASELMFLMAPPTKICLQLTVKLSHLIQVLRKMLVLTITLNMMLVMQIDLLGTLRLIFISHKMYLIFFMFSWCVYCNKFTLNITNIYIKYYICLYHII